jgi:malonate-semialdehyde dehydrogenase (acetylating)/methylmalonate-semialdehyde dehydrogenase
VPLWIDGTRSGDGCARRHHQSGDGRVTKRAVLQTADIDAAVQAAQRAFPAWRDAPPLRRARILMRFRELLDQNKDALAQLITAEHGKTLADAGGSVQRGIEVVEFAMGIPHLVKGEHSEEVGTGVDCHSLRQPLGVCAGITLFNFPVMVPLWMFPVALACGNMFVLKPSGSAVGIAAYGGAAEGSRTARRGIQRRARRQGGGRCTAQSSRHQGDLIRRFDPDR